MINLQCNIMKREGPRSKNLLASIKRSFGLCMHAPGARALPGLLLHMVWWGHDDTSLWRRSAPRTLAHGITPAHRRETLGPLARCRHVEPPHRRRWSSSLSPRFDAVLTHVCRLRYIVIDDLDVNDCNQCNHASSQQHIAYLHQWCKNTWFVKKKANLLCFANHVLRMYSYRLWNLRWCLLYPRFHVCLHHSMHLFFRQINNIYINHSITPCIFF